MAQIIYPLDTSGKSSANLTESEVHLLTGSEFGDYNYIVPKYAPFYELTTDDEDLVIRHIDTNRVLEKGVDYSYGHQHKYMSLITMRRVFGSIVFHDITLTGEIEISPYQAVGGEHQVTAEQTLELMSDLSINPKVTTWSSVLGSPDSVPPIAHWFDWEDLKGTDELIVAINEVTAAITAKNDSVTDLRTSIIEEIVGLSPIDEYDTLTKIGEKLRLLQDHHYPVYCSEFPVVRDRLGWNPSKTTLTSTVFSCGAIRTTSEKIDVLVLSESKLHHIEVNKYGQVTESEHATSLTGTAIAMYLNDSGVYTVLNYDGAVWSGNVSNPAFVTNDVAGVSTGWKKLNGVVGGPVLVLNPAKEVMVLDNGGVTALNLPSEPVNYCWMVDTDNYLTVDGSGVIENIVNGTSVSTATIDLSDIDDLFLMKDGVSPILGANRAGTLELMDRYGSSLSTMDLGNVVSLSDIDAWYDDGLLLSSSRLSSSLVSHDSGVSIRPYRLVSHKIGDVRPRPLENLNERYGHNRYEVLNASGSSRAIVELADDGLNVLISSSLTI